MTFDGTAAGEMCAQGLHHKNRPDDLSLKFQYTRDTPYGISLYPWAMERDLQKSVLEIQKLSSLQPPPTKFQPPVHPRRHQLCHYSQHGIIPQIEMLFQSVPVPWSTILLGAALRLARMIVRRVAWSIVAPMARHDYSERVPEVRVPSPWLSWAHKNVWAPEDWMIVNTPAEEHPPSLPHPPRRLPTPNANVNTTARRASATPGIPEFSTAAPINMFKARKPPPVAIDRPHVASLSPWGVHPLIPSLPFSAPLLVPLELRIALPANRWRCMERIHALRIRGMQCGLHHGVASLVWTCCILYSALSGSQIWHKQMGGVRATLDVSHKAAGQRGILRASYDKTEGIYSPGQRGILRERGATSGVWVNVRRVRSCKAVKLRSAEAPKLRNTETPKHQNAKTPKRQNAKTPKRRSSEVLKLRNVETLRRRRFWDGEKLRNSETPKHRNAEAPKRRGIVTPRHHGPRRFISGCEPPKSPRLRSAAASKHENARNPRNAEALRASEVVRLWLWARGSGGGSVVAANLRTSEPPNRRTAGGPSAHDPEYANLANSSPERGQQPGEEVNLGGVRRKGPWRGGGGGGDERERAEVEASMVPSEIVRWWLRTAEPPNRRIAEAPDRRVAETPDRRIAETLDLRITGHLSRRTYEAPKVVRRAPEVVRPIVDVGSEKGLRRLVATRRYWDAYRGTGRNVGASGGMRTGGTGCLQAVGCAEQAHALALYLDCRTSPSVSRRSPNAPYCTLAPLWLCSEPRASYPLAVDGRLPRVLVHLHHWTCVESPTLALWRIGTPVGSQTLPAPLGCLPNAPSALRDLIRALCDHSRYSELFTYLRLQFCDIGPAPCLCWPIDPARNPRACSSVHRRSSETSSEPCATILGLPSLASACDQLALSATSDFSQVSPCLTPRPVRTCAQHRRPSVVAVRDLSSLMHARNRSPSAGCFGIGHPPLRLGRTICLKLCRIFAMHSWITDVFASAPLPDPLASQGLGPRSGRGFGPELGSPLGADPLI
ncbi:hypothetical protein GGX14DRAFT_648201 [Mycena pura]|uniref:Uncharacterized protein n=1 Tax=Mycena pura TaxID=153505 RepID=A0AAD6Y7Q4_9AGAR|nr:hypothetical protein GGX14DRAFT_648201 [Mycena pura]